MGPNTVLRNFCKFGMSRRRGSGYFPKLPKRVSAAQHGRDFGKLSFVAKLGLSCCVSTCVLLRDVWVKP